MANTRCQSVWILVLTSLGFFMSMMDSMIVTTASTAIRQEFKISIETLQWAMNAYNIAIAAVLLIGVSLGERYGRRNIYLHGILIFTIGSILCALATNITSLIIARVIEGVGASVMTPMSMAILTNAVPAKERGKSLGIWSGIGGLALIVGPSLGGLIVAKLAWQWIFWINVPIGIVAIWLSLKFLPESVGNSEQINWIDTLLVVFGTTSIIWTLSAVTNKSELEQMAVFGIVGVSLLGWFIFRQTVAKAPMIPLRFFHISAFANGNIGTFLLYGAMYGVVFFLPQYFQVVGQANALQAGLEILPWTGTLVFIAPFAGKAVDYFGENKVATWGLFLQGFGYALLATLTRYQLGYGWLIFPLMIAGAGLSMAGPALQKSVLGAVEPIEVGKASGIYNLFRLFGGAVGTAISVLIFGFFGSTMSSELFSMGFQATILGAASLSFLGVFFSFRLQK